MKQIKTFFFLLGIILPTALLAQNWNNQRVLPIGSYFKDVSLKNSGNFSPVFPIQDKSTNYYAATQDSIKRYSIIGYYLFQRELIEIQTENGKLWITPLLDVRIGQQFADSTSRISQNTRGVRLEGALGKNIFFSTSFYENQAVFENYVGAYITQRGEQYVNPSDSSYYTQNGVVPGAARTKFFKDNGFDYAYAIGHLNWNINKKLSVSWGNQSLFVGSGHRSMLWSDNSVPAMNLRVSYAFSEKWDLQFVRMRGLNLLRRPNTINVEAYYEPKSLSFTTLYFKPSKKITIGLFEGGSWYRGDSIHKTAIQAAYFIPLPGAATVQEAVSKDCYSLLGIDFNVHPSKTIQFYGQFGLNIFTNSSEVAQIGTRIFPLKSSPLSFFQVEWNYANTQAYTSSNPRSNYSSYNLPIAHPMGKNLNELLVRLNYEWKNLFVTVSSSNYLKQSGNYTSLMPVNKNEVNSVQRIFNESAELGYRINRSYGLEIFGAFRYRMAKTTVENYSAMWISLGLRTQLSNHYFDF